MSNSSLEFDHIFFFSSPDLLESEILKQKGFQLNAGRIHQGQGTANKCVTFENNYLELIYLKTEEEAKNNFLQLHRRAYWRATGASPFGIALRGNLDHTQLNEFTEYHPEYLPSGTILIHKQNETLPLIFIMPPKNNASDYYPKNWPHLDKNLLIHSNGARNIVSVELKGPNYRWPLNKNISNVVLKDANQTHLEITINGKTNEAFKLNREVTILIQSN